MRRISSQRLRREKTLVNTVRKGVNGTQNSWDFDELHDRVPWYDIFAQYDRAKYDHGHGSADARNGEQ